jgi:hypothetical protein
MVMATATATVKATAAAAAVAVAAVAATRQQWRQRRCPWWLWLQVLRHCKSHLGKESKLPNRKRIPLHVQWFRRQII